MIIKLKLSNDHLNVWGENIIFGWLNKVFLYFFSLCFFCRQVVYMFLSMSFIFTVYSEMGNQKIFQNQGLNKFLVAEHNLNVSTFVWFYLFEKNTNFCTKDKICVTNEKYWRFYIRWFFFILSVVFFSVLKNNQSLLDSSLLVYLYSDSSFKLHENRKHCTDNVC